jgi:hypothetical protein
MPLSTRSYSKESRSSAYYSRSSSYHSNANNSYNSSYGFRGLTDFDRPLSTRLIERDFSSPSLAWNWDSPFFFDRLRWRFDDDFFKLHYGLGRCIPINYRGYITSSSSKCIPIQYRPSSTKCRHQLYKKNDDLSSSFAKRFDENSMSKYILFK